MLLWVILWSILELLLFNYESFICTEKLKQQTGTDSRKDLQVQKDGSTHIAAQTFTFRELAAATKNFRQDCLLGEGGFGRVYRGRLENGQVQFIPLVINFV